MIGPLVCLRPDVVQDDDADLRSEPGVKATSTRCDAAELRRMLQAPMTKPDRQALRGAISDMRVQLSRLAPLLDTLRCEAVHRRSNALWQLSYMSPCQGDVPDMLVDVHEEMRSMLETVAQRAFRIAGHETFGGDLVAAGNVLRLADRIRDQSRLLIGEMRAGRLPVRAAIIADLSPNAGLLLQGADLARPDACAPLVEQLSRLKAHRREFKVPDGAGSRYLSASWRDRCSIL